MVKAAKPDVGLDPLANPALSDEDAEAEAQAKAQAEAEIEERIAQGIADGLAKAAADKQLAFEDAGVAPLVAAKRVRIVVEENDDIPPTGLFIGINGRSYMIRPGEEVDVPEEVVSCLNDAVMATPKTDMQGNVVDYRNRLRFPYRIVSSDL